MALKWLIALDRADAAIFALTAGFPKLPKFVTGKNFRQSLIDIPQLSSSGEHTWKDLASRVHTQLAFPTISTKLVRFLDRFPGVDTAPTADAPFSIRPNAFHPQRLQEGVCAFQAPFVLFHFDYPDTQW